MRLAAEIFAKGEPDRFQRIGEAHYVLSCAEQLNTDLEVTHVRRDRHELRAELTVHCGLAGVSTTDGVLFFASVNLSSHRDRDGLARTLQTRTATHKIETQRWAAAVDELSIRVRRAEQVGDPAVLLSQVVKRPADDWLRAYGFALPRRHPAMVFGDGDTLKTYAAGAIAVTLAQQGRRIGLVDWEMSEDEHKDRVERLDPMQLGAIAYLSCARPLIYERDRVAQMRHDHQLDYLIFDSVGFGCHDKPEAAESAMQYFRAVRSLGVGSFHIAHVAKGEHGDQKPFGSAFWFNSVRALWFAKRAEAGPEASVVEIGLYPRKFNLGAPQRPFALRFRFGGERTQVQQVDATDVESLAMALSIKDRIKHLLKTGPKTVPQIADDLEQKPESVKRIINRHLAGNRGAKVILFAKTPDERVGLCDTWRQP
jgi:hypothetical protein